jgi:transposase
MLRANYEPRLSEQDHEIFEQLVPREHYLRQVKAVVDFERYRAAMATCYSPSEGRGADDPVLLLKLGFLQTHYNLSDREVMAQAQVNVAFRFFLDLGLQESLPHPSLLTVFRARLGVDLYAQIFDGAVAQARSAGLVKDRLRLKDATHVIANVAVPATIRLVAQMRQRLLDAAEPWAGQQVAAERAKAEAIHVATTDLTDAERLLHRVEHLRHLVEWVDALVVGLGPAPDNPSPAWLALTEALALAHRILSDRDNPRGGDQVVSLQDPAARNGKHGAFFTGYLLDVAMDADSQIITALEVLPANGDEAADATALIAHEETVHGNDIQTLSIDKAGFRGDLLRTWQDPDGLALNVVVPPILPAPSPYFTAADFRHDADQGTLTCPGQVVTARRMRNRVDTGWTYSFPHATCQACPLQAQCLEKLPKTSGRMVVINDYAAEYAAARQQAQTPAFLRVRRDHPAIERKLAEIVRQHDGRRARYRGRPHTRIQYLLTGLVVNVKRMVRLLRGAPPPKQPTPLRDAIPAQRPSAAPAPSLYWVGSAFAMCRGGHVSHRSSRLATTFSAVSSRGNTF